MGLLSDGYYVVADSELFPYKDIRRLEEGEAYPRAIGCYLGGDTVLLLDGHHKAAAQASKGKMVKCLVIMPVNGLAIPEEYILSKNEREKAYDRIILDAGHYPVYPEYEVAKDVFQEECRWIFMSVPVDTEWIRIRRLRIFFME